MIMCRYKIRETIKDGTQICGYKLICADGSIVIKDRNEVEQLARAGYIDNVTACISKDNVITLKGRGCKLRDFPVIKLNDREIRVTYRVTALYTKDRRTVGYKLVSSTGVVADANLTQAVELARNGTIIGVGVQKFDKEYRLRGKDGFSLEKLPVYKLRSVADGQK